MNLIKIALGEQNLKAFLWDSQYMAIKDTYF
jgi:hypothetical protein